MTMFGVSSAMTIEDIPTKMKISACRTFCNLMFNTQVFPGSIGLSEVKKIFDLFVVQRGSKEGQFVDPPVPEAQSLFSFLVAGLYRNSSDAERVMRPCLKFI